MQFIWRRTTYLFWRYPVLWLPVLSADLVNFVITRLQKSLTPLLLASFGPHESVFSNRQAPLFPGSVPAIKSIWISGSLLWTRNFACLCLYGLALIVTSRLVLSIESRSSERAIDTIQFAVRKHLQVILLTLKLIALGIVAFVLGSNPYVYDHRPGFIDPDLYIEGIAVAQLALIAFVLAPAGFRLLANTLTALYSTTSKNFSRLLAVLTVIFSAATGYALRLIEIRLAFGRHTYWSVAQPVIEIFASLIAAIPFIAFFIALSLIASRNNPLSLPGTGQLTCL